jgi:galactose-1-phosphate uridylyltransferase
MRKHSPNIVLTNYSLRGILDTLFNTEVQTVLYNETFESIKTALQTKKRECVVCNIGQLETTITLSKPSWEPALKSILEHYVKIEDYDKCSQINKLIQELNGEGSKK